jgi:hypothetical protein
VESKEILLASLGYDCAEEGGRNFMKRTTVGCQVFLVDRYYLST